MSDESKMPDSERTKGYGPGEHLRPPDPQPEQHGDPTEPEQSAGGSGPSCGVAGTLGGCGCLIIILLILMLVGVIPWPWAGGQADDDPADLSQIEDEHYPADEPGREGALAWAQTHRPGRDISVDYHSEDWTWARLIIHGHDDDPVGWVELHWSTEGYNVLAEGSIQRAGATPGEQAAREAALDHIDEPDWVTRVESHSDDWTEATVWAGPPDSEWVYIVNLEWDESEEAYDLVSVDDIDYP
jgi:hypothetical protein